MKLPRLFSLALLASALSLGAGEKVFSSNHGFTITLPDDWEELPTFALDMFSEQLARAAPGAKRQTYDYGYHPTNALNWFAYPYLIVQVKDTGRIPEAALTKYRSVQSGFAKGVSNRMERYKGVMSQAQINEMTYDATQCVLWSHISMNVERVGEVISLSAMKMTQKGFILFMACTEQASADELLPVFTRAINSVTLDPSLVYVPDRSSSGQRILRATLNGAMYGAVAGAVVVLVRRFKKRKNTPPSSA